jgi:hypothetical protein
VPLFQLLFDEVFTYTKKYSSKLIWWDFNSPFLSQTVCFLIARYSLMPEFALGKKSGNFGGLVGINYLATTLTNQNSIHEEIKSRLKSGNACYHSVQNFFSSS